MYKVQAYLNECLDSVLNQDFTDLEVVAVDDCSPDHSGAILDVRQALDDRLRVVHLDTNVGLGPARNRGLACATGEYVLFLDSDDTMTPGSLAAIAAQLTAMDFPEMLILDHARTYWWGKIQRNLRHGLLGELSTSTFTADGHPEIFELLQVAWNKVCRRDFLEREQLVFPAGYYEDTPWTYKGILTAKTIATLPRVCIHYRQRRHGNILGTASSRHAEAFEQWERVFAFLDSRPDLAAWRSVAADRMAHHYLTVLRHPGRLSTKDRADFFARASEHLRRFGAAPPPALSLNGRATLHACLYRGDLRAFDALRMAKRGVTKFNGYRRTATTTARKGQRKAKTAAKRFLYRRQLKQPLDPNLAVFASYWNRGAMGNPLAIFRAMQQAAPHMHGVWLVRADRRHTMPPGIDYVVPGTPRYWEVVARATYFVNDVNFPDDIVKRRGQVHIQTQHGTPLKHMGLDLMEHPAASKGMVFRKLLGRSDRWDYNLSANRFSTLVWEKAFPSDFTSVESGYPRNDELVNATAQDVAAAREELGIPAGKIAVLYAPTHRDHDKHFILRADLKQLATDLGPDFVVLVRAHYFYKWLPELAQLERDGLLLNVSQSPSVEKLMLASDVLVTDYSSIMFDYANLDRPIVVFASDWETYREVRGVYFDLFEKRPGHIATTQPALTQLLTSRAYDDEESTSSRQAFREEFCQFDDGRAAERVVRALMLGEPMLSVTPLDARNIPPRPAALRKTAASSSEDLPTAHPALDLRSAEVPVQPRADVPAEDLEPDPGMSFAEPYPTGEEDLNAVSWEPSDDAESAYAPVPVLRDPEQAPWQASTGEDD